MNRVVRRYQFSASVPPQEIENTILLAVLAAEGLHGQSRVRLEAAYAVDAKKHACVIDVGSEIGRDISRVFTGFAIREFGEDAFAVSLADRKPKENGEGRGNT